MNIPDIIGQYNESDCELSVAFAHPVLLMPTSNPRFPNCYGKVRLSVMLRSLPSVLAFIKSDGTSKDPSILTAEEIEAVINHIRAHCVPGTEGAS